MSSVRTWYHAGLRFSCTGCGTCCRHVDGYVWVGVDEARALAEHLNMELDDFGRRYLRTVGTRYALLDGRQSACVFLEDDRCRVYDHRPRQCRTVPFWPAHLTSDEAWRRVASECEGIRDDAELVACDHIELFLAPVRD